MTVDELREWFGGIMARRHGCRVDHRGQPTRPPCPSCRETATLLTDAWRERFVTDR